MPNTSKDCSDSTNYKTKTTSVKKADECSQVLKGTGSSTSSKTTSDAKVSQKANQAMNKTQ